MTGRGRPGRLHPGWWRLVESYLIMALGGTLIATVRTGHFLRYVRPELAVPLVLTGIALVAVGLWTVIVTCRRRAAAWPAADDHGHDHDHDHGVVRSVWLIVIPVVVAAAISPPAVGAQLAQRRGSAPAAPATSSTFAPLPAGDPLGIPLDGYAERSVGGGATELAGRRYTMSGFVINRPEGGDWYLARIWIRCCAADAVPILVRVVGAPPYPDDGWVEVTGSYLPAAEEASGPVARLDAESVRPVEEPESPYIFG